MADHLGVKVNGDTMKIDYFFNEESYCDSLTIAYICNGCAEDDIETILGEKFKRWKKFENDFYISRCRFSKGYRDDELYYSSPALLIDRAPDKYICSTLHLWLAEMPKEKWKAMTKK